ncbi:hypothetical protein ACUSM0_005232, partial [Escherichia coli]
VVSAIAHRYGLKPQISEMLMDIEIDHADQTEESDCNQVNHLIPTRVLVKGGEITCKMLK